MARKTAKPSGHQLGQCRLDKSKAAVLRDDSLHADSCGKAKLRMKWPKVDLTKTFREIEKEYDITEERDDERPWNLGHHPSKSYYSKPEPDFGETRKEYDEKVKKGRL
jgi:hypothetical protein